MCSINSRFIVSSGEDMKLVDEELWRRLEELEREEEEQRTREEQEQEQEREESAQEEGGRSVRDKEREMGDSSDGSDSDSDAGRGPLRITVKHSSAETGAKVCKELSVLSQLWNPFLSLRREVKNRKRKRRKLRNLTVSLSLVVLGTSSDSILARRRS